MNIELKHIKLYKQLSKDSLSFSAKIYVDGKWFGECANTGDGGMSTYHLRDPFNKEAKQKLAEIEDHFKQMAPVTRKIPKELDPEENEYTIKMNLAEWIDMQVDELWCKKEEQRVRELELKQQQRLNKKHII